MKQPEDNKTAELDLEAKRGRGRPALENALTPAQRAKRYRDNKRAANKTTPAIKRDKMSVTKNAGMVTADEFMRLKRMYWSLENQVALANAERDAAFKAHSILEEALFATTRERDAARDANRTAQAAVKKRTKAQLEAEKKFIAF